MQRQQAWMKDYQVDKEGLTEFKFHNVVKKNMIPSQAAKLILNLLGKLENQNLSQDEFFNYLREKISSLGIMVMQNGVVGKNTHRKLDVTEFRAFALSDELVPLIFINAVDSQTAKVFSLAHELVHILLGENEVLNVSALEQVKKERWINLVTENVLMPEAKFKEVYQNSINLELTARKFYVSLAVAAIRAKNLELISQQETNEILVDNQYDSEKQKVSSGGNYYNNVISRLDPRYANAVINSEAAGELPTNDAAEMLGVSLGTYQETTNRILEAEK